MFTGVHDNGYFVERTTYGAISPSTGRTLPDRYIEGTCPICGYGEARGDQCDNCGNQLEPTDLIDPRSRIDGAVPEFGETDHFFLDLPPLAGALRTYLEGRAAAGTWRPNVIKFSLNILDDIKPRAMTRDIDWGIPLPGELATRYPTKRFYVWFDAVIGYLSASIEWARRIGDPDRGREWWNDPEALSYYFMGKDNITFHSQIWPAELLGYAGKGDKGGEPGAFGELNLPTEVVSSEFLTMEGKQFSTSRGYVIHLRHVLETYGPDALRYFICAAGPESQDSNFTWAEFVQRNNSELVAGWGNLVSRTAAMIAKAFGEIPEPGPLEPVDEAVREAVLQAFDSVGELISRNRIRAAIAEAMRAVGDVNKYVADTEPFKLKGEDQQVRRATVLHTLAQSVSDLNTILSPFLPHAANRVHAVLGGEGQFVPMPEVRDVTDLDDGRPYVVVTGDYSATPPWASRPVRVGATVSKPEPIFTKLDEDVVGTELARAGA
jgi:methionyl-tRNA synthetase